jgi:hypothetical protein
MKITKTKYYQSIETLPLYNFDKYRNTRDLNWFLIGYDGRQTKQSNTSLEALEKVILDEYFKAIDDRSFTNRLQKWAEIEVLKTKYFVVKSLINRMWLGFGNNQMELRLLFVKELASHGFRMPEINSLDGDKFELNRLNTGCEGIKTKIALIEMELNKDAKVENTSLAKQLQIATIGLQYPYRLDAKTISVLEWIEICKLLDEKVKQN